MVGGTQVPVGGSRIPKPEEEKEEEIRILDYRFKNKDEFLNSMPPGYRFSPTDEEAILYFLRPKIENKPLPINGIMEVNIYQYDPEDLTALFPPCGNHKDGIDQWFFFTPRDRKYPNGMRPSRRAGKGYWKAIGGDKAVKCENQTIGYRKVLVFCRGNAPKGEKTNWIMYEFRGKEPPRSPSANTMRLDIVLSKIYKQPNKPLTRRSSTHVPESEPEPPQPVKVEAGGMEQNGDQTRLFTQGTGQELNQIISYADPYEEQCYYNSSQMPLQTQQPQPTTEIFQTPQEHDNFALQSNTQFPILDPSVFMPFPTLHQPIHSIGNEFGGQGLDNFDIINGAFGNSSFDAGNNIDFGNVPDLDASIVFGNVPGLDSTDYGNPGLCPMSSNMNGNYGRQL
ncbi:NAC domain-containing protein 1 [Vitis vinifera]|nr:NAC domain-containing protein 1 [Vitis vinifera]|eukprot:XP_019076035.1 PREDICTED: NAC domain-containing protein 2-like [Vitis vinifera]